MSEMCELMTPQGAELLEQYAEVPHLEVAMKTQNPALATAVKYIQKAAASGKLPDWAEKKCLIDAELYEQCTSQTAAVAKFSDFTTGKLAVDLTCGLGVDSWAMAQHFERVISVEINPQKAEIVRHNFQKLEVENIEVRNQSAEEFCQWAVEENITADFVYIDPSRVSIDGKKVYSLEDSSPNVIALLPMMRKIAPQILIKLSPLFDIKECYTVFGEDAQITIITSEGECKEILVGLSTDSTKTTQNTVNHIITHNEKVTKIPVNPHKTLHHKKLETSPQHIYTPDVAFYKSRTVEQYINSICRDTPFRFENYIFTENPIPTSFCAQHYSIQEIHPYSPKTIAKLLKSKGISRATLHLRNFPQTTQQIKKALRITEGSQQHLFFTTYDNKPTVFFVSLEQL